jgi:hypothetical protein
MTPKRRLPATSHLSDRDLGLLAWTGEQYAARLDHLQTLAGIGMQVLGKILRRMRAAELARMEWIVVGQPAWAIPTAGGLAACGLSYEVWTPALALLAHVAAINDVRLHVQAQRPDSRWISERQIEQETPKRARRGSYLPDGVLILEEHSVAVEVELSVKKHQRRVAVLDHHARRFDGILYYCAPQAYRQLTRLKQTGRWPKLEVRELPQPRYLRER